MSEETKIVEATIEEVGGGVTVQKQSTLGKVMKTIFVTDAKTLGDYLLFDVAVPMAKNTMYKIGVEFWRKLLGVENDAITKTTANGVKITDYNAISKGATSVALSSVRQLKTFEFENIIFEKKGDAIGVLEDLKELLTHYPAISIGDMYDKTKIRCNAPGLDCPFTYNNYGWSNLAEATIVELTNGSYMIQFPKEPTEIKLLK